MRSEQKVNVLLVDDHPENLFALEAILDHLGQNLVKAHSGEEALRYLLHQDFAVILLDVQMPGLDGFEAANLIRSRERSRHTPIIFLTAFNQSDNWVYKGYSLGAVDYLVKPVKPEILTSKVSVFVDLFRKTEEVKRQALELEAVNAELRASEYRLQNFLDNANDLIQIISPQGKFLYVNRAWQETLGYSSTHLVGLSYLDIVHPSSRIHCASHIDRVQNQKGNLRLEIIFVTATGEEVSVEGSINCRFEDGKPTAIQCIFHDIRERQKAEAIRAQMLQEQLARQQAEAANRMKDEFLATLSHELRTPLNSIMGWSHLLRSKKFDDATTNRALETIERNAKLQTQLIEDILDISRIITGKLHLSILPLKPVAIVEAAIEAVKPSAAAKNINLNLYISDRIPETIAGDSIRLQQIVWNLLTNAIKFTPRGGNINIYIDREVSQGFVVIKISDTGIGISQDFLPYIFDRFRQADSTSTRAHGGLGLGLAIVRHLVELHGGTIAVDSEGENKGSTFTVCLPISNFDATQQEVTSTNPSTEEEFSELIYANLQGLTLLVVDDESDVRDFLTMFLEQCGARVIAVESATRALAALKQYEFDLLISDIGMPYEDGYQLIQEIRQQELLGKKQVPAIALTAYARVEDKRKAVEAGFQLHLKKPIDPTELAIAITQLIQSQPSQTVNSSTADNFSTISSLS